MLKFLNTKFYEYGGSAGSHRESNPGPLTLATSALSTAMTTRQPSALHNPLYTARVVLIAIRTSLGNITPSGVKPYKWFATMLIADCEVLTVVCLWCFAISGYIYIYIYIIHLTNIISLHLIVQYVKDYFNSEKESLLTLQILISKLSSLEELHSKTIVLMVDYICQQIQEFEKTMAGIILAYIKHNL